MDIKRWFMAATISLLTLSLVGCNTINGMGKDIEKAGQAIQKSTN
ncbi:entericidin A/B family lipoprotein [Methylobacillus flagellatus]